MKVVNISYASNPINHRPVMCQHKKRSSSSPSLQSTASVNVDILLPIRMCRRRSTIDPSIIRSVIDPVTVTVANVTALNPITIAISMGMTVSVSVSMSVAVSMTVAMMMTMSMIMLICERALIPVLSTDSPLDQLFSPTTLSLCLLFLKGPLKLRRFLPASECLHLLGAGRPLLKLRSLFLPRLVIVEPPVQGAKEVVVVWFFVAFALVCDLEELSVGAGNAEGVEAWCRLAFAETVENVFMELNRVIVAFLLGIQLGKQNSELQGGFVEGAADVGKVVADVMAEVDGVREFVQAGKSLNEGAADVENQR